MSDLTDVPITDEPEVAEETPATNDSNEEASQPDAASPVEEVSLQDEQDEDPPQNDSSEATAAPATEEISLEEEQKTEEVKEKTEEVNLKEEETEAVSLEEEKKETQDQEVSEQAPAETIESDDEDIFDKPAAKPSKSKSKKKKEEAKPVKKASKSSTSSDKAAASSATKPPPKTDNSDFEISVSEPQKVGDGMSSYIAYKVKTKTNSPNFNQPEIEVQHRYSEFHSLYKKLVDTHPGIVVPPPPPKDAMNTGVLKFKSQADELTPFLERRKAGLERFIQRCVGHPVLRTDDLLISFLQTEDKIPKHKGSGFSGVMSKLVSYAETDEWFSDKNGEVENIETQLKKLQSALEHMVKRRKELAGHTTFFAESFAALADAEEIDSLKNAMHQMADVEAKVARLHSKQEHRDFYDLSEIVADFVAMCGAMKICFQQRIQAYKDWQNAEATLVKKRDLEAKYTAANRADKLDQAAQDVTDAEEAVKTTKAQFDNISETIKNEWKRFDIQRANELKTTMIEYVESMMTLQHQVVKAWEAFLPEAKAIGQES